MVWTQIVPEYPYALAFCCDASDYGSIFDPWNRRLSGIAVPFFHGIGEDQELGGYIYDTSVEGQLVKLTIFND
jgi:hypothetical protein